MPTTFSGSAAAPASEVTRIDDVLVASTVPGPQISDSSANRSRFRSGRSGPPRSPVAGRELVQRGRPAAAAPSSSPAGFAADVLLAALERLGDRVVQPGLHARLHAELRDPPAPIVPAPTTPSRWGGRSPALEVGARFSMNAVIPSTRSSVAIAISNRRRSCSRPASGRCRRRPARPAWPAARRSARGGATTCASSTALASHSFFVATWLTSPTRRPPARRSGGRSGPAPSPAACPARAPAAGCRRRPGSAPA